MVVRFHDGVVSRETINQRLCQLTNKFNLDAYVPHPFGSCRSSILNLAKISDIEVSGITAASESSPSGVVLLSRYIFPLSLQLVKFSFYISLIEFCWRVSCGRYSATFLLMLARWKLQITH